MYVRMARLVRLPVSQPFKGDTDLSLLHRPAGRPSTLTFNPLPFNQPLCAVGRWTWLVNKENYPPSQPSRLAK